MVAFLGQSIPIILGCTKRPDCFCETCTLKKRRTAQKQHERTYFKQRKRKR